MKTFEQYSGGDIKKEVENITRGKVSNVVDDGDLVTFLLNVENLSDTQLQGLQQRLGLLTISAYDDNKFIVTIHHKR